MLVDLVVEQAISVYFVQRFVDHRFVVQDVLVLQWHLILNIIVHILCLAIL